VTVDTGTILLGDVRARAAAALAPVEADDPDVLFDVVDAVSPPALMLLWDDPWLEPESFGRDLWSASLMVLCLASRIDPAPGIVKLEQLVAYTLARLRADDYTWPAATVRAPRQFPIGNVTYLGAQVVYDVTVTT